MLDVSAAKLPELRDVRAVIGGELATAAEGGRYLVTSPVTGKGWTEVPDCTAVDVDRAVRAASRWVRQNSVPLAPKDRAGLLFKLAALMERDGELLACLETFDSGKTISATRGIDVPAAIACVRFYAELVDKVFDRIAPAASGTLPCIRRYPVGVVAAILPWNYPLLMAVWKLAPALAAGNAVILKPSPNTPLTTLWLAQLALEAGAGPGQVQAVSGRSAALGEALGAHSGVHMIALTGSTATAKHFYAYAARSSLKKLSLECGGKSPHVVLASCDQLPEAARAVARGVFANQGAVCNAGSRLIVERSIADSFLHLVLEEAQRFQPRDPRTPGEGNGALIDETHAITIERQLRLARAQGAQVLAGGERTLQTLGGAYLTPAIVTNVDHEATIAREEVFGPVLSVICADDPEHALQLANDTDFGLAAAVWTAELRTAHTFAERLKAGIVWVNCFDRGAMAMPFGGWFESGFDADKGIEAFDKYCRTKAVWVNYA